MTTAPRRIGLFRHFWFLSAAIAVLTVIAGAPASAANRLALVIGNNAYEEVEALDRAVADARTYRTVLEEERGFKVFYAEDAKRREMNDRVSEFLAAIRPGDVTMIVYSGHGVQLDSERRDSLFLLPTDFPNRDPGRGAERHFFDSESVNFARLAENVAARGAKLRIFVLDACRNNPFGRKDGTRAIGVSRGIGRIQSASGEFVIYAAAPGEVAFDSLPGDPTDSENSVFTRAFIKHFRSGAYLEDVANDVQAEVVKLARAANVEQEPYYSDGVAGRTCLEESCGQAISNSARLAAEQEELYWKYCEENNEPLYCRAFLERYPESWRAGLAQARLKVLTDRPARTAGDDRVAAVDTSGKSDGSVVRGGNTDGSPAAGETDADTGAGGGEAPTTGAASPADTNAATGGDKAAGAETAGGTATAPTGGDTGTNVDDGAAPPKTGLTAVDDAAGDGTTTAVDGPASGTDATADGGTDGAGGTATSDAETKSGDATTDTAPGGTDGDGDFKVAAIDPEKVAAVSTERINPTRDQLRDVQARLTVLGHKPGPIDGLMGERTRRAITAFQKSEEMDQDGNVSEALIARLSARVPDEALKDFHAALEAEARERDRRARERRERRARERAINSRDSTTPDRTTRTTTAPKTATTPKTGTTRPKTTGDRVVTVPGTGIRVRTNIRLRSEGSGTSSGDKPFYCNANTSRQRWDNECR